MRPQLPMQNSAGGRGSSLHTIASCRKREVGRWRRHWREVRSVRPHRRCRSSQDAERWSPQITTSTILPGSGVKPCRRSVRARDWLSARSGRMSSPARRYRNHAIPPVPGSTAGCPLPGRMDYRATAGSGIDEREFSGSRRISIGRSPTSRGPERSHTALETGPAILYASTPWWNAAILKSRTPAPGRASPPFHPAR